jgi:hypothetical protein
MCSSSRGTKSRIHLRKHSLGPLAGRPPTRSHNAATWRVRPRSVLPTRNNLDAKYHARLRKHSLKVRLLPMRKSNGAGRHSHPLNHHVSRIRARITRNNRAKCRVHRSLEVHRRARFLGLRRHIAETGCDRTGSYLLRTSKRPC